MKIRVFYFILFLSSVLSSIVTATISHMQDVSKFQAIEGEPIAAPSVNQYFRCTHPGGRCTLNTDCCGRSSTCARGICENSEVGIACGPTGATCTFNNQCCDNICQFGRCNGCLPQGSRCAFSSECCADAGAGRNCVLNKCGGCMADGFGCAQSTDCCSGACRYGQCESCRADGDTCTTNSDCCAKVCSRNGKCNRFDDPNPIGSCSKGKGRGEICTSNSECCRNFPCDFGTCGGCGAFGIQCNFDWDCCDTICRYGTCGGSSPSRKTFTRAQSDANGTFAHAHSSKLVLYTSFLCLLKFLQ